MSAAPCNENKADKHLVMICNLHNKCNGFFNEILFMCNVKFLEFLKRQVVQTLKLHYVIYGTK